MEVAGQSVRRRGSQAITGVLAGYETDWETLGTDVALEDHRSARCESR